MSAQDRIRERIDQFVSELSDLIRKAALEAVSSSLQDMPSAPAPSKPRGRPPVVARPAASVRVAPSASAAMSGAAARRGGGAKRAPEELERLTDSLLEYIQINPGEGIESIARELGAPSKELQLPLKKLLSTGKVVKKGQKRSTKYFPR